MLSLSRDCDAEIRIRLDITIKVLSAQKRGVKSGVDAPSGAQIRRHEISHEPYLRLGNGKANGTADARIQTQMRNIQT